MANDFLGQILGSVLGSAPGGSLRGSDLSGGCGGLHGFRSRSARDFGFEMSYPRGNPHGVDYEPWHWRYGAAG